MQRALELAQNGQGNVSPNPLVGCVIVHNDVIIGEGWHKRCGEPHAEVNAINSVDNKSLLKESVLYVTLEPCSHYGKTPPCADLIVENKIPNVVICNLDPFSEVNGRGIQKLRDNGVNVEVGILENEGYKLNKRFFTYIEKKRPFVILKWAQTTDKFIARKNFDSKWISNEESRKLVHKMRAEEDAILVGHNTALHDNPSLTTRDWKGNNPVRIVIDRDLNLPKGLNLFDGSVQTLCINSLEDKKLNKVEYIKVDFNQLEKHIIQALYLRKIQSVIIEGGAQTIQKFIDQNLWDEARVFESTELFKEGIEAPQLDLDFCSKQKIANNILTIYQNVG